MCRLTKNSERGTVLLMTLLISGLLAMVSLSFGDSIRNQMASTGSEVIALQADLSAQSGVEYARRQLTLDPTWAGTNGSVVQVVDGLGFDIQRLAGEVSDFKPTEASFLIEGLTDGGRAKVQSDIKVEPGDPIRTKALSILGGDMNGINVDITGDALWIEDAAVRWTYQPGAQSSHEGEKHFSDLASSGVWLQVNDQRPKPDLNVDRMNLRGQLWTVHGSGNFDQNLEVDLEQPVHTPGWDLDSYLTNSDCVRVFDGNRRLEGVTMRKTAVFKLAPGDTLTLVDCRLLGGAVVWVESGWDPQEGPRNQVILAGNNVIGGDSKCSGNLGLLAPGCKVMTWGQRRQVLHGLNIWHSAWQLRRVDSRGMAVILDDFWGVKDCSFNFDIDVAINPPDGVLFFGRMPEVDVVLTKEA